MSKEVPKRLQGPEWYTKKDSLIMTQYRINEKGHIKGTYTDMKGNLYSHWFSNKEIEEFNMTFEKKEPTAAEAYEAALNMKYGIYAGIDRGANPDETAVRLEIPRLDISDIEMNIDRVLSSSELMKQMNELVIKDEQEKYVRVLMNRLHKVKEVRDYIDNKIQKSMKYDWGISGNRSDRMFTETVIELQLVIEKLDEIIESKGD